MSKAQQDILQTMLVGGARLLHRHGLSRRVVLEKRNDPYSRQTVPEHTFRAMTEAGWVVPLETLNYCTEYVVAPHLGGPGFEGKYGKIAAENKKFHPGEPVFILRATDRHTPETVRDYASRCERAGCSKAHVNSVRRAAQAIENWQRANRLLVKENPD